jgi:hypothetical protein
MRLAVPGKLLFRDTTPGDSKSCFDEEMRDQVILFIHVIATFTRLLSPGGIRSVVAESVLLKQQLPILNRSNGTRLLTRYRADGNVP